MKASSGELLVAVDEVVDAQVVDIDVVGDALPRKILAEIVAVGAYLLGQLLQGEVVLQVELRGHAALGQQMLDLGKRPTCQSALKTLLLKALS